jgi:hypothetical protein
MNQILAMTKPHASCAIHCATADGFFKGNEFFDFAEPFGSAIFLSSMSSWSAAIGSKAVLSKTSFRARPGISLRFYYRKMADQVRHDEAFN